MKEYTEFWDGQLFEIMTSEEKIYFTQLIWNKSDMLIQPPVNKQNIPMSIENGMCVTVSFLDDERGVCKFDTKIYRHLNGRISLNKPDTSEIKVVQRRKFFRVKIMLDMDLTLPPAEGINENREEIEAENITVTTHDISGGGVAFFTNFKIVEIGDQVTGVLYLKEKSDTQKIAFKGKIVNVMKQQNKMFKNAIQFMDMREGTRSKIVQFCIRKQIEIRNKLKR
ncbi:flagellar brake protein [Oceanobacillus sp. CFH 90083]|uniref:flagellar brake protein n=1 Tax=Oceanobacillus sp. CFH 90083 TaxID=2592336 RepID=UPI00128C4F74|nr:PilZ domain-containing protein [Oceanobacillus sp. CFH 90083]